MNKNYTVMELEAIKYLCKCVNSVASLPADLIADTNVATNTTYSSYKIDAEMSALENDIQRYVDTALAGLNKLSKEVIDDKTLVVKENVLYLYKDPTDMNNDYMQMMLINGTVVELGSTTCNMSGYYTNTEIDNDFLKKTDADGKYATITAVDGKANTSDLTTHTDNTDIHITSAERTKLDKVDEKVNKTSITTTIDSTSVDTQVPSAKTIYDEFIVDKIKDYHVNINSSTALSKYGIDDITTLTSLLSLTSKLETNIRFTMQINDAFKQTLYDCGVIPVNVGGLLVISQQYRGKAVYTTDFCETYVNVTSNVKSSEWGKWQKVRTTTVGDVGVTTITPVNSAITGTMEYTIKNGICYVSLSNVKSTTSSNNLSISTTMPKPAISSSSAIYKQLGGVNIGMVYINKNTTQLTANIYTTDKIGDCSFSYPVAE